jgi:hypothetical protein
VTLTATVAVVSPGAGTPTGSVDFKNGSTDLGSGTVTNGIASVQTSSLPAGTDAITAIYSGDTNFTTSTSTAVNQQVNLGSPTVALTVSNTNPFGFEPVTLTAIVSAPAGLGTPNGVVTFFDINGTNLGSGPLTNGTTSITTTTLPVGRESITAVYSGNSTFNTATSPAVAMVVGTQAELFVNQVFLDVMNVPAGRAGTYWVALIDAGFPSKQIATEIVRSLQAKVQAVDNVYQQFLGRSTTTSELNQALASRATTTTLDVKVLSSREYYQTQGGGTINGFLSALSQDFFGTAFPTAQEARLARQLQRGVPRSRVVHNVITSPSGTTTQINDIYEKILERPATSKEVKRFTPLIQRGQFNQVMIDLFGSREFNQKFVNIT